MTSKAAETNWTKINSKTPKCNKIIYYKGYKGDKGRENEETIEKGIKRRERKDIKNYNGKLYYHY